MAAKKSKLETAPGVKRPLVSRSINVQPVSKPPMSPKEAAKILKRSGVRIPVPLSISDTFFWLNKSLQISKIVDKENNAKQSGFKSSASRKRKLDSENEQPHKR